PATRLHRTSNRLPRCAGRHHHGRPAGGRPRQRRDRTPPVHRSQQSVLEHDPQCANGQPASGHLPICAFTLRRLAEARLDRSSDHHGIGPRPQHYRPRAHRIEKGAMNTLAASAFIRSASSVSTPVAVHAAVDTKSLPEKVSIRNLDFFYGESKALKGITLPLYQNKATAFIGPSGCGKSTLLRVLNRMYDLYPNQHATGEVSFDGEDILSPRQDLNLLRSRIGMVFQKPTPFPMSIYENIAFGVRLYE